jgi:hypothetical protein
MKGQDEEEEKDAEEEVKWEKIMMKNREGK